MIMAKGKHEQPAGYKLSGKTSDRIRAGKIQADALASRPQGDPPPKTSSILRALGFGLGRGATRGRNGGAS